MYFCSSYHNLGIPYGQSSDTSRSWESERRTELWGNLTIERKTCVGLTAAIPIITDSLTSMIALLGIHLDCKFGTEGARFLSDVSVVGQLEHAGGA